MNFIFDLQRFADAGTLVNATGNYVNAYTGVATSFSGNNTLTPEMKTYYDTELLENTRAKMVHAQFARTQNIPKGRGTKIEWRKFNTLANADKLTEGVIPTGQNLGVTYIDDTVDQYGTYVSVSDVLDLTAIDPVMLEANQELGASAAKTRDELVRNDIVTGTSVLYAQKLAGSPAVLTDVTSRLGLDATAKLTPDTIARAATILKKNNAQTIDGDYVAIVHPSVAYDLRANPEWIDVHKYAATAEIFDGEIGKLHGVRFVETTQAKIIKGADLASDSRTLKVSSNISAGAVTSIGVTGGTITNDSLKGRTVTVGGYVFNVTGNTTSALTVESVTTTAQIAANSVIYPAEGGSNGLAVYCTMVLGKEAYGTTSVDGGGLEMIVHGKHEIGGPLDQFSTIGYKLMSNGAKILYEDRMVRVESCGTYSATDDAN